MRVPSVAVALPLFVGAGLAGAVAFVLSGGTGVGFVWAAVVFVLVVAAWATVAALRGRNRSRVEQP